MKEEKKVETRLRRRKHWMRSLWKTFEAGAIRDGVVASVVAVDLPHGSNALLKQLGEILGVETLDVHGPPVYLSLHREVPYGI